MWYTAGLSRGLEGGDGLAGLDPGICLTGSHFTVLGAGAGRRRGSSRLQHSLVHAKARTENRPCQVVTLHLPAGTCGILGLGAGLIGKLEEPPLLGYNRP